jgi:hypothetical protein
MRSNKEIEHFRVTPAKGRAISDGSRIDPAFANATVAESCHLTVWNPRLLHLRARGFASLTFSACPVRAGSDCVIGLFRLGS